MKFSDKRILVTGGNGFLGQYVVRRLKAFGASNIFVPSSTEYDLRNKIVCEKVVKHTDIVIHLAAQIGGIGFISDHSGEVFYNNIVMGVQLMEASRQAGVEKFISVGTACEYPEVLPLPFKEKDIWDGSPEDVTAPYGWAKKMLLIQGEAYKKQYGFNAIQVIPVNLFGPGDNFDSKSSHVIPSLIRKIIEARDKNSPSVEVWGSGKATREFLYVEDAAEGIILSLEKYDGIEPINLGTGIETSIREVTEVIMKIAGYKGSIAWNTSKPDGQPRRQLDITKARKLGFAPKVSLNSGLEKTVEWYEKTRLLKSNGRTKKA